MDKQWIVSSSPHIRTKEDTSYIMKQVILALMPATLAGLYYFAYAHNARRDRHVPAQRAA